MKYKCFDTLIQSKLKLLYNYAYSLIPDELQSRQLVLDGMNAYVFSELKTYVTYHEFTEAEELSPEQKREMTNGILSRIYLLAEKRWPQLSQSIELPLGPKKAFYLLNINKRSILFLKSIESFGMDDIAEIHDSPVTSVSFSLNEARSLIFKNTGKEFEW